MPNFNCQSVDLGKRNHNRTQEWERLLSFSRTHYGPTWAKLLQHFNLKECHDLTLWNTLNLITYWDIKGRCALSTERNIPPPFMRWEENDMERQAALLERTVHSVIRTLTAQQLSWERNKHKKSLLREQWPGHQGQACVLSATAASHFSCRLLYLFPLIIHQFGSRFYLNME